MTQELIDKFISSARGTFLEEDRNSNFPNENTLLMTDNNHPITPPPELVQEWIKDANHNKPMFAQVAVTAARWGADQELEACCEWLDKAPFGLALNKGASQLRLARRPKPPRS